jgi:dephospho-CoA kinase
MLKIGITGGIGTGKTTACKLFEKYNIPVYYADDRAKWLMNNNPLIREALLEAFGEEVFDENNQLNRPYLGQLIFNDQTQLDLINSIVHPAVREDGAQWQIIQEENEAPYSLKEAALLFESGSYQFLDKIIVVTAPEELRIQRVMQRDNIDQKAVLARIQKQMPQQEKEAKADFILENISLVELEKQVALLHKKILQLSS